MIRRINLFAGPGAGKSTIAAWLFSEMKTDGFAIEQVREYVKNWAYMKIHPTSFDQVYLLGKQMHEEDVPLRNNVDYIVTDCPIFLGACYGMRYNTRGVEHIVSLCNVFEEDYPSINIFIDRGNKPYKTGGRFQTEEEAREMDEFVMEKLNEHNYNPLIVKFGDKQGTKELVYEKIK